MEGDLLVDRPGAGQAAPHPSCPELDGLGLPGRRYPFRATTHADEAALLADIEAVLVWAKPRIEFLAESRARRCHLSDADADDMAANVLAVLWKHLPKYDRQRGCLLNYIYLVATSRLKDQATSIRLRRSREVAMNGAMDAFASPSAAFDIEASSLAEHITDRPTEYFDPGDVRVFHALFRAKNQGEAAHLLGCSRQSVSRSIARMIDQLRVIAQEELT